MNKPTSISQRILQAHCQVAPADTQARAWRQRVSVPKHPKTVRQTNVRRRTPNAQQR